eukprot:tig00000194_g14729.t1
MNYDDLVMKWARERGWIKTMEEIEKENLLGPAGRYGPVDAAGKGGFRAGYTPDLSPMFNAQTANISSEHNRPYGRNDVDFSKGNPFGAMLMDQQGTRALRCRRHGRKDFTTSDQREALNQVRQEGTVAGMETDDQFDIQKAFQAMVVETQDRQKNIRRETNARMAEMYQKAAASLAR